MSSIAIHITLEPKTGKPVSLACVLRSGGSASRSPSGDIDMARAQAAEVWDVDDLLGGIRANRRTS
jgi:hypothetical protein